MLVSFQWGLRLITSDNTGREVTYLIIHREGVMLVIVSLHRARGWIYLTAYGVEDRPMVTSFCKVDEAAYFLLHGGRCESTMTAQVIGCLSYFTLD